MAGAPVNADPACPGEMDGRGELGPVHETETLARVALSPTHKKKSGGFKPSVFPVGHIQDGKLSLTRTQKVDRQEFEAITNDILVKSGQENILGYLIGNAGQARELRDDNGNRMCCVVDDPIKDLPDYRDNIAHALIKVPDGAGEDAGRELRSKLIAIFEPLRQIEEVPLAAVSTAAARRSLWSRIREWCRL